MNGNGYWKNISMRSTYKRMLPNKVLATRKLICRLIYIIAIVTGILLLPMSHATENDEAIKGLREMIFNLDPNEIGITQDKLNHPVWGMVMETGFETGSFTLVTLADGTTSLYFSTGGGTIGAGEHENVRKAVGHYLTGAQYFYKNASKVEETPGPVEGEVIFYFLTFEGKFAYSAPEEKLGNGNDELSNLFYAAHAVMREIREIEKK
ncbi:MAG: hypothetical protein ACR2QW_14910 [bacterium]